MCKFKRTTYLYCGHVTEFGIEECLRVTHPSSTNSFPCPGFPPVEAQLYKYCDECLKPQPRVWKQMQDAFQGKAATPSTHDGQVTAQELSRKASLLTTLASAGTFSGETASSSSLARLAGMLSKVKSPSDAEWKPPVFRQRKASKRPRVANKRIPMPKPGPKDK